MFLPLVRGLLQVLPEGESSSPMGEGSNPKPERVNESEG